MIEGPSVTVQVALLDMYGMHAHVDSMSSMAAPANGRKEVLLASAASDTAGKGETGSRERWRVCPVVSTTRSSADIAAEHSGPQLDGVLVWHR